MLGSKNQKHKLQKTLVGTRVRVGFGSGRDLGPGLDQALGGYERVSVSRGT